MNERRRRDLNPRAAINDLHPFQGCPFGQLGYFSEYITVIKLLFKNLKLNCIFNERRGWDSNPCALADKRFSRPPRYDHFDTSPCFAPESVRDLFYHQNAFVSTTFLMFFWFFCIFSKVHILCLIFQGFSNIHLRSEDLLELLS